MKKIMFFIPNLKGGGAEKVLVNLVNNMNLDKYEITILLLFNEGINIQNVNDKVKINYIFKKTFRGNSYILKIFHPRILYYLFIKEKYNVIIAYLEGIPTRVIGGCNDDETKKIAWVHTTIEENKFFKPFRSKKEALYCYSKYDRIVAVSEVVKQSINRSMGYNNVVTRYNTIDVEEIKKQSVKPVDSNLYLSENINMVTVGRLTQVKGYQRLLRVCKRLKHDGIKYKLYILGDGEEYAHLVQYINENRLNESVYLLGYKSNPYKYISRADFFVCSSYREGFSTAITEATILGIPTVTTLCSGMNEILDNGKCGLIVENDEEKLYEGLKKICSNKELLNTYQIEARKRAHYFIAEESVRRVEELLEEVLKT